MLCIVVSGAFYQTRRDQCGKKTDYSESFDLLNVLSPLSVRLPCPIHLVSGGDLGDGIFILFYFFCSPGSCFSDLSHSLRSASFSIFPFFFFKSFFNVCWVFVMNILVIVVNL